MIREQTLYDSNTFRPQNFCTLFYVPGYVPASPWFIVYANLNRISILLLCENCINLNYVELVHGAFQVYLNLENPRDGGARWAAVCGVAQSRTRLKRLSSSSSSSNNIKRHLKITHIFSSAMWHLPRQIFDLAIESLSKVKRLKNTEGFFKN